jgi:hypothetical protein
VIVVIVGGPFRQVAIREDHLCCVASTMICESTSTCVSAIHFRFEAGGAVPANG